MKTPPCPKCKKSELVILNTTKGTMMSGASCGMFKIPPRRVTSKGFLCRRCNHKWIVDRAPPPNDEEIAVSVRRRPKARIQFAG